MKKKGHSTSFQPAGAKPEGEGLLEGLVVAGSRGMYHVQPDVGALGCSIRGRLRKRLVRATGAGGRGRVQRVRVKEHDPVAIGDRVRVLVMGAGTSSIEEVLPRTSGALARRDPDAGRGELTTLVSLDQLVAVFAARAPEPHLGLLDRLLVLAEQQDLVAIVCINKVDLGLEPELQRRLRLCEGLGYPVLWTSSATGSGITVLRERLAGKVSAFAGPSGVGKSSLLNALLPQRDERTGVMSSATQKGRHTTTGARLFPLAGGGAIADTPGFRAFALASIDPDGLDRCFREFQTYLGQCTHTDCGQLREPDCAVQAALRSGAIDAGRYRSYRRLRGELSGLLKA